MDGKIVAVVVAAALAASCSGEPERPVLEVLGIGRCDDSAREYGTFTVDVSMRMMRATVRNNSDDPITPLAFQHAVDCDTGGFSDEPPPLSPELCTASSTPPSFETLTIEPGQTAGIVYEAFSAELGAAAVARSIFPGAYPLRLRVSFIGTAPDGSVVESNERFGIVMPCDGCVDSCTQPTTEL